MSYKDSSYFFSRQNKTIESINHDQESCLVMFLQLLHDEFGKEYQYCTYPDYDMGYRIGIIFDDDGEELVRVSLGSKYLTELKIVNESYQYFANFERQLKRFWIKLYEKYKINKNEFYKRQKIKKFYK